MSIPDPEKLRLLANWFDAEQTAGRWAGSNQTVQSDLREWADGIDDYKKRDVERLDKLLGVLNNFGLLKNGMEPWQVSRAIQAGLQPVARKTRNDNMDNFGVHVTARDPESFRAAFRLAFYPPGDKVTHFIVQPIVQENWGIKKSVPALVLCWHEDRELTALPYAMDCETALTFAEGWLKQQPYPPEPDHDGDNAKGFQLTTGDFWGHIGTHYSTLAVLPCWSLLGK